MAVMPARADRTRSTSTTRARPLPPRRPRRWGRLLVLGLTLVLVATLGTRALADTDDGHSLDSLSTLDSSGDSGQPTRSETKPPLVAYVALNTTNERGGRDED